MHDGLKGFLVVAACIAIIVFAGLQSSGKRHSSGREVAILATDLEQAALYATDDEYNAKRANYSKKWERADRTNDKRALPPEAFDLLRKHTFSLRQ